jgi:hypothetical protein
MVWLKFVVVGPVSGLSGKNGFLVRLEWPSFELLNAFGRDSSGLCCQLKPLLYATVT